VLYLLSTWKEAYRENRYILLVNFILALLMYLQMHFSTPYAMAYDYRYIAPFASVSLAYFIAQGNVKFAGTRLKVVRYLVPAQFVLWCGFSVLFILYIGY
jgi:hypothetical protein